MTDPNAELNAEIRRRVQRARRLDVTEEPAPTDATQAQEGQRGAAPTQTPPAGSGASSGRSVDFGAGRGRAVEPEPPDMSTLIRAAHYGVAIRQEGTR